MSEASKTLAVRSVDELWRVTTRRSFLKLLGVGGTIMLMPALFEACDQPTSPQNGGLFGGTSSSASLDLSTDTGILNYAYALEQLEAAFYTAAVASTAFGGFTVEQKEVFTDLQSHEVIHREFFKAALGSNAIGTLALNTPNVTASLASTASILRTAEAFEDLGVAAYNGAGKYLKNATYLTLAGKIVSVEARHAAAIRDMRDALGVTGTDAPGTRFAGDSVVAPAGTYAGLDVKLEPSVVLGRVAATGFVSTSLAIGTQPPATAGTPDAPPPSPTP
jgi:rubrerythrin